MKIGDNIMVVLKDGREVPATITQYNETVGIIKFITTDNYKIVGEANIDKIMTSINEKPISESYNWLDNNYSANDNLRQIFYNYGVVTPMTIALPFAGCYLAKGNDGHGVAIIETIDKENLAVSSNNFSKLTEFINILVRLYTEQEEYLFSDDVHDTIEDFYPDITLQDIKI